MQNIRTRFSPSPTGYIHIGNARAALFAAMVSSQNQGHFVLRIEDTDATRSSETYTDVLKENLHWLGITWQEGPDVGGPFGPYWQSLRQDIYQTYYQMLEDQGHIYPCFCTDQELLLSRKRQLSSGQPPRYSGVCKKLTPEQIEIRLQAGDKPAWRFKVPENQTVTFTDLVKGDQAFLTNIIGDFIIRRKDGTAPFLFCNAIDDALMQITHVIRGEDHLTNTPRQLLLLQTLKLHVPLYGHLSLIVGDDGAPLSKRHGSFSLYDLKARGYLPLALLNYLARLGHAIDHNDLLHFEELAKNFSLEKLSKSPARFDLAQLRYWQKAAVAALSIDELWHWLGEEVAATVPLEVRDAFAGIVQANITFPEDARQWSKIFFHEHVEVTQETKETLLETDEQYFVEAENAANEFGADITKILEHLKKSLNINGKKLFMPMRLALTGRTDGPHLKEIALMIGPKKIKTRLSDAFQLISSKAG